MKVDNATIASLRVNYQSEPFDMEHTDVSPIVQFGKWFHEAMASQVLEPNALTLATASLTGKPTARIVLLKGYNEQGFVFYTNYNSDKGKELASNPQATMVFLWLELHRQIRIEGKVEKITAEESTAYFQSRPKGSQIGAHASPQSQVIPNREILEENVKNLNAQYANVDILPRPEHWGGYRVIPEVVEFWQGRPSRLHDRIRYTLIDGAWKRERLAP
jgi:pyridoxamine 5'-phosphate oxidase